MNYRQSLVLSFSAAGLIFGLAGCVDQNWIVPQTPAAPTPYTKTSLPKADSSVQQVSGRFTSTQQVRVDEMGRKLLEANKSLALKPKLEVRPGATLEITHQGDHRVVLSEGMVNACASDGQLAAVLAVELGRMVAERQTRQQAAAADEDRLPPVDVPLGPDGGGYGSQARQAELAKLGFDRRKSSEPTPSADGTALAQQILTRAGFQSAELAGVAGLTRPAGPTQR